MTSERGTRPAGPGEAGAPVLSERVVGQVMRRNFVTVSARESLLEAMRIMQLGRLRHLLVERNGVLAGVLSYRSLQDRALSRLEPSSAPLPPPIEEVAVEEAMMDTPYVVSPDTRLQDAAGRLLRLGLGCLPVVDDAAGTPRLVGIVTEADLLHAAYDGP